jgi:hypothetical protein
MCWRVTGGRVVRALTPELKAQLYSMLATNATGSWNVTVPKAFPRAYRYPLPAPFFHHTTRTHTHTHRHMTHTAHTHGTMILWY